MFEMPRGGGGQALAALGRLLVRGVALGALAVVSCGGAARGEEAGPSASEGVGAFSSEEAAIGFWMDRWADPPPDAPMYLRLPAGVDTRLWREMSEGYTEWVRRQKQFDTPVEGVYQQDYEFTWDVFTWNIPVWRSVLVPFAGRPDLNYLEIGIAEGRAILWMLENVLTHPTSRATGIDPFLVDGHEARFRENVKKSPRPENVQVIKGFSQDVLPELEPESYDIIYIDGSHLAGDVLLDAVYTWRLLKDGGLVIHDDYILDAKGPPDMRPTVAVDAFVTGRRNTVEVLHRGRQLILRKLPLELPGSCWNRDPCLRIGGYLYAWNSHRLVEVGTGKAVSLSMQERTVLKEILRLRRLGAEAELVLEEDVAELRSRFPEAFERVARRVDLKVSSPASAGERGRARDSATTGRPPPAP